ncbi:MAG: bifunctional demethylmenaquinone methyltransferase/2-methoxy-6-polyprenyl-1,4-benzoquinol methylase UbiE [Bacteroidales bacterium]|nr:bifunctional demethylmenaquinone methyltransferase/2-methoxy-6-polyprenyl-1,4-benzoquinol methylase UbiE [Bacteroidales bacterium]
MDYPQEQIKPYGEDGSKTEQVAEMFDHIAPTYDRLNHMLSFDIDKLWRRKAIRKLRSLHPERILDVATGTGDFAIQTYKHIHPTELVAIDISEGMLQQARVKANGLDINFHQADCMALPFASDYFDVVTVAFGVRNFEHLDQGLCEMQRVLRNDGRLIVLELSEPTSFPLKQLYHWYSKDILPNIGRFVSHDKEAYKYLPQSIKAFPEAMQMRRILQDDGFRKVNIHRLTGGICTLYEAMK